MVEPRFSDIDPCLWDSAMETPLRKHILFVKNPIGKNSLQLAYRNQSPNFPEGLLP